MTIGTPVVLTVFDDGYSVPIVKNSQRRRLHKAADEDDVSRLTNKPLSHLCSLSTVAHGSRVHGFPQIFRRSYPFHTYAVQAAVLCDTVRQVATVAMETTQLVLSQFNFLT